MIHVPRYPPRALLVLRRPVFVARRSRRYRLAWFMCCVVFSYWRLVPPRRQGEVVEMCMYIMSHRDDVWLLTRRPSFTFSFLCSSPQVRMLLLVRLPSWLWCLLRSPARHAGLLPCRTLMLHELVGCWARLVLVLCHGLV
jgi:hypothetical protein